MREEGAREAPKRLIVVVALSLAWTGCGGLRDDEPPAPEASPNSASTGEQVPEAPIRGCEQRVESKVIQPNARRDSIIGSIAFTGLPNVFESVRRDAAERNAKGLLPLKTVTLVDAGTDVTLEIPPEQRQWMRLAYAYGLNRDESRDAETAITLAPCDRSSSGKEQRVECGFSPPRACASGVTQFNGGFLVDFERAGGSVPCASLRFWFESESEPVVAHPFSSEGQC